MIFLLYLCIIKYNNMEKLVLDQPVYLKTINNEARSGTRIIDTKISKIDKKYFYCEKIPRNKFRISDLREETQYCKNYEVYFDKQVLLDELETIRIYNKIRIFFECYAHDVTNIIMTLDQLKKIAEILETN
jgi:hypothetical protein